MGVNEINAVQALVALLVVIFGPTGAAIVGVKVGLNGLREDVRETKQTVKEIQTDVRGHGERIATLEAQR